MQLSTYRENTPEPVGPQRAFAFLRWLAATGAIAWVAPYALLALIAAVCGVLGIESWHVRREIVAAATQDTEAWASAGPHWNLFALVCGLVAVAWRIVRARTVREHLNNWSSRLEEAASLAVAPLSARLEQLPRASSLIVLFVVVAVGGLFLFAAVGDRSTRPLLKDQVMPSLPKLPPSAVVSLLDGSLRAGNATIEQRDANTFVVVFSKADE